MSRFGYVKAASLDQAIDLLSEPGLVSKPLAGGTDIMVYARQGEISVDRLVDISAIPELKAIRQLEDEVHLGAAVTFSAAARSDLLNQVAPLLVQACASVGGPQIRNLGTIGGNVANAAACADAFPPLVCLDAVAHIRGEAGQRQIPVTDLSPRPHTTVLLPGELITHFSFQILPPGARGIFIKLGRRNAQSISRLSIAAIGRTDENGYVDYVRLTPGAATPRTIRFTDVEDMVLGQRPDDELLAAAGRQAAQTMVEITGRRWSTEYKEIAIRALTVRALRAVLQGGSRP